MRTRKLSGLFINCPQAQDSIFESGMMVFQCLRNSDRFSLDYLEVGDENLLISAKYDFYLFNYHFATMSRLNTKTLKKLLPGLKMTIVLEISPNDPFVHCPPDDFDAYIVLDPTLKIKQANAFAFPRPLEKPDEQIIHREKEIPVIGSFGFATPGKGFEHVVDAVNREFDRAVVKINIPFATYVPGNEAEAERMAETCRKKAKTGIEVVVTHDFMSKPELIEWCAQNTLNCFLYDRNQPGLAATTDQAVTSGRPLITSKNNTFRHIQKYIKPFPYQTLKSAVENSAERVREIQKDWSPRSFAQRFEEVLKTFQFTEKADTGKIIELPLIPEEKLYPEPFQTVAAFLGFRTRIKNYQDGHGFVRRSPETQPKIIPAVSYSQFGEDLAVFNFFKEIPLKSMSYLDIGANNPKYISNTYLFYEQGFRGVLVEPNRSLCEKLKAERPEDIVLNVGVGTNENVTEADFYQFPETSDGLSTFSAEEAKYWGEVGMNGVKYKFDSTIKMPLVAVNDIIAENFTECPDFISIDVEGWDLKILESFDFEKYSPAVFCVETLAYRDDGSTYRIEEIYEFMESKGYFSFHQTFANDLFVNRNLYDFYIYQKDVKVQKSEVAGHK